MTKRFVPVPGIVGPRGTGKPTLLRKLLSLLRERGLWVGYPKHSHHALAIDQPGKDSFDVAAAGAFGGEAPGDELVRRCREARASPAEPRAGWLSIRVGERYWLAPIALAGDDPTPASVRTHLMTEHEADAAASPSTADGAALAQLEARMHRRIYTAQPEAHAVVGARMPYTAAVGFRGRSFEPVDPDGADAFGSVPALTLERDTLADKGPAAVAEQLAARGACILAGQGAYTWGRNLSEALQRAALLERSAEIYTLWRQATV